MRWQYIHRSWAAHKHELKRHFIAASNQLRMQVQDAAMREAMSLLHCLHLANLIGCSCIVITSNQIGLQCKISAVSELKNYREALPVSAQKKIKRIVEKHSRQHLKVQA
jgi:hypothetical protein